MMKIATIRRKPEDDGWDVSIVGDDPAQPCAGFRLRRTPNGFPLPATPPKGAPDWAGEVHEELCTDTNGKKIDKLYNDVMVSEARAEDVVKLGRYLLSVLFRGQGMELLGPAEARINPGEPLAVELAVEPGDAELQRLPWELAHGPSGPLAARTVPVAFFRTVKGVSTTGPKLELPLRVLFVVGNPQDDMIRPGSEILGLLQRLRMPPLGSAGTAGAVQSRGVGLQVRILVEATREALKTEIDDFRPQAVHFICHGVWTATGSQIKLRMAKPSGAAGEMVDDALDAATLLGLLKGQRGSTPLAPVVVLNACHTGVPGERREGYVAFAAELVAGGVRVAVGMAGEVADTACREFTHAAYEALVAGEPILTATARARRAAMLNYRNFLSDVEWGRPVLYMAEGAPPGFQVNQSQQVLVVASSRYRKKDQREVLCDRFEAMSAYQSFQREARPPDGFVALAFEDSREAGGDKPYRVGKTRLLQEIASRAVFDGFVPCMIEYIGDKPEDKPANLMKFALELARVMDEVRGYFNCEPRVESDAFSVAFRVCKQSTGFDPGDKMDYRIRQNKVEKLVQDATGPFGPEGSDLTLVREAIQTDLRRLLDDVKRVVPDARAVLVMIDNLHLLSDVAEVLIKAVDFNGIGSPAVFAPLVISYLTRGDSGGRVQKAIKDKSGLIKRKNLDRFLEPVETRLAYTQYLLSMEPPHLVSSRLEKRKAVEDFFQIMHKYVQGVPSYLENDRLDGLIEFTITQGMLKLAGPEAQFQAGHSGGGA